MQLVQVDALELQALKTPFQILAQLLRPAVLVPARRLRPHQAAFRADDQVLQIGMQRLCDADLAVMRAVALRGIDEIRAELISAAQHAVRVRLVLRRSPDVRVLDDAHRAVADAVYAELTDFHSPVP